MAVVAQAGTGDRPWSSSTAQTHVTLMDLRLPGMSGVEAIERFAARPAARFVVPHHLRGR